ncbi:fatty acid--CoA ligase [Pacificimonas flava]|uniref:Fatty acid--CoA ligase n=2 Tax=Pacificimonas TaxID=1960290 RepID=A0A219B2D0_9SPHN|nr:MULTISPECIES: class I adenylate-forming enzyme family protein [Pacificimonas]MBZ6377863.1 acyl--CoA ligase [Pacificimonas aurantium]OWV32475.1 fatty acid--CoA ligase [Pacificimonas flava]
MASQAQRTPPADWPKVDIPETYRILTAPGAPFEMEEATVQGRSYRVYKNALGTLREVFDQAREWGERDYMVFENERQTYGQHFRAAGRLGRILSERYGVKKGDRVVIAMRNLPEFSLAFWAAASIGAIITPLNGWGSGEELAYGVLDSGAKVVFVDGERLDRLRPHLPGLQTSAVIVTRPGPDGTAGATPLEDLVGTPSGYDDLPDDPPPDPGLQTDDYATILYTSGTTGRPKGALGTHRNIMTNLVSITFNGARAAVRRGEGIPETPEPDPDDPQPATLIPVPLFHVTGINSMMVPAVVGGAKIVLMYKWNPERFLELIERERVTGTTGVPAMVWQVLESPDFDKYDLSSLQGYGYGGAAIAPELTMRFVEQFPWFPVGQGYGATETSSVSVAHSAEDYLLHPDSVGLPVPCVDLKVVDEKGDEVPAGMSGELCIRGPNVVHGYWNNPEQTAAAFPDGWYHTGDVCRIDPDGFVYLLDRKKDMLIRGGENIYCVEVESVLVAHRNVIDAAVVGLPDRVLGEEVGAVVQLKPGTDVGEEELRAYVADHLAPFKVPIHIDIRTEEFPRNASGKTLKPVLREELLAKLGRDKNG